MKFAHQQLNKPVTTFQDIKDDLIQKVQKEFKHDHDVAVSLHEGTLIDLPSLMPEQPLTKLVDANGNPTTKGEIDQKGLDMVYSARFKLHLDWEDLLQVNLKKTYALIFSTYCTTQMQQSVQELPKFDTEIWDNPSKLLSTIETLAHNPVRARYPFELLTHSAARFLNIWQQKNEDLIDWGKQFKQEQDIFKNHIGTDILKHFVEQTEDYQKTLVQKQVLKDQAWEQWCAYMFVKHSYPK
jgi:hypothetical protein